METEVSGEETSRNILKYECQTKLKLVNKLGETCEQ